MKISDIARFWSKVDKSGGPDACWPWTGGTANGYGVFWLDGKLTGAHRVACQFKHGPIGELHALHSCDNPPCCNPDHTFPGTNLDNVADCVSKSRNTRPFGNASGYMVDPIKRVRGADMHSAKLTEDQVREIRVRHEAGESQRSLGAAFGCSKVTIGKIVRKERWSHVK